MGDLIKKTGVFALVCALGAVVIMTCLHVCSNLEQRTAQERQERVLKEIFGEKALCVLQSDSLDFAGLSWKIVKPGVNEIHYAFALEHTPDNAFPGGLVVLDSAGIITHARLFVSLENSLSLRALLGSLLTRERLAGRDRNTRNTENTIAQALQGVSVVNPLEIVVRADAPEIKTEQQTGNILYVTQARAPLYRLAAEALKPMAQAMQNRTYGSVLP